jgi:hypothetical protein
MTEAKQNDIKDNVRPGSEDDDENLMKVVLPEGELTIPMGNGVSKKVFWKRVGFGNRVYFRSYFKKKLRESINQGLLGVEGTYSGPPEGKVDGANIIFTLSPATIDEKSLKVFHGRTQLRPEEYSYSVDLRVLSILIPPKEKVTVEYSYYDSEIYNTIYEDSYTTVLIFLCAHDAQDTSKRAFESIEDVGRLTITEIQEILNLYAGLRPFGEIQPNVEKLKNSSTPPPTSGEGSSQSETSSIPGEQKSGEKLEETTKSSD